MSSAVWYRRQKPVSEEELKHLKHKKKLEKDQKKSKKEGKERERVNISWFISAFSAFCIMGGTFLPILDIIFDNSSYSIIMVTMFGISSTYVAGSIVVFTFFGALIPGIVLLLSGAFAVKYSYNLRQEKQGNWDLRILILSIIDVSMLILNLILIISQKSFFTTRVGYTASLNDVNMILSLGFYIILIGVILGFFAGGWNKLYEYRSKQESSENK